MPAGERGTDGGSGEWVVGGVDRRLDAGQHYFATQDEMLPYALQHWLSLGVHERFTARIRTRLAGEADGSPAAALRAVAAENLPYDGASWSEVLIAVTSCREQP